MANVVVSIRRMRAIGKVHVKADYGSRPELKPRKCSEHPIVAILKALEEAGHKRLS